MKPKPVVKKKNHFFLPICCLLMYFVILSVSSAGNQPETVRMCSDFEWPPFNYEDRGSFTGTSTDILREIFRRKEIPTEIGRYPWKRCLYMVEKGEYQIIIDISRNIEREKKYLVSKPLYEVHHGLYYVKERFPDGPPVKNAADLDNFRIGGIFGYNFENYRFDTSKIDSCTQTASALIKKMRAGWIDFAIGYTEVFQGLDKMGKIDLSGIEFIEISQSEPLVFHVMITRKEGGEQLLRIINSGLDDLKLDGSYRKIFLKYGIEIR